MKNYKAYIFDMDGTLVDSERIKGQALAATCVLLGGKVDVAVYKGVMGESWEFVANHFFEKSKISPTMEEFNKEFKVIYESLLREHLVPNLNVMNYLRKLKSQGKKMAIVTSASKWMADQILAQLELTEYFKFTITNELVSNHKPHPESYLLVLEKLALASDQVLVFEDSEPGLVAANKANCESIAFRHGFNSNHDLSLAIKTISDYDEM